MSSTSAPRVSVIIPVHNTANFLDECLTSVFEQTLGNDQMEVIAVDDGSTDDSASILDQWATRYSNMTVIHQEASGGAAHPRNVGIAASSGEYLIFVDSDDYLDREALQKLVDLADETGSGIILPRMTSFGSAQARASGTVKKTMKAVPYVKSRAYRTGHPCKLFRASIIRDGNLRFPTGYRIGEDMPFTFTVGLRSPHISMLGDRPYYFVRWRDDRSSLRQKGQTTDEVLLKNVTVMRTILRECSVSEDRITLLQRSVLGRGGLWCVFTHPRVDQWSDSQAREAFAQAHELLIEAWKPEFRRSGSLHAHLMTTLIWSNDYDGAADLAASIASKERIDIRESRFGHPRYFVSSTGTVVEHALEEDEL